MKYLALLLALVLPLNAVAMVTPSFFVNGSSVIPSNTTTRYYPCSGVGGLAVGPDTSPYQGPIPIAGDYSNFTVRFPTNVVTGSYSVELRKNQVAALTVVVDSTNPNGGVDASSVSFNGTTDTCDIRIVPTGPPTAQTADVQLSAAFTSTTAGESFVAGSISALTTTGVAYGPLGYLSTTQTDENVVLAPFPTNGTIDHLYVELDGVPGASASYDLYLRVNNATTTLTCQISGAVARDCSDTTHSVAITAGQVVSISTVPSTGTAPTARGAEYAVRFVPTIDGESVVMAANGNSSATLTRFAPLEGINTNDAGESNNYGIAPVDFTWRKLYLNYQVAPGAGNNRAWYGRINNATSSLVADVTGTNTTADSAGLSASVLAGDLINYVIEPISNPASPTRQRVASVIFIDPGGAPAPDPVNPPTLRINNGRLHVNFGVIHIR